MNTVDGVAHILTRGDNKAEGDEHHHSNRIMQTEHRWVDVDMADLHEVLEAAENVKHVLTGA